MSFRRLDDYEENFLKENDFERVREKYRRRIVLEFLSRRNARRILEIGCGISPLFTDVAGFDEFHIVEPIPSFVERATELAAGDSRIFFHQSRLEDEPGLSGAGPFDAIVASSILHEVEDSDIFLEKIRALCTTETTVHFNASNAKSFHNLIAFEMGLIGDPHELSKRAVRLQRKRVFDPETLVECLNKRGFRCVESGTFFFKPFPDSQMQKLLEEGVLNEQMLEAYMKVIKYIPDFGSEIYAHVQVS